MTTIISATTHDVRFPTGQHGHGSDAMNKDPDYSAAYLILETDQKGLSGHSLVFTIGRGNDLQCESIAQLAEAVIGESVERLVDRIGDIGRDIGRDSQMRWLGPEKGIPHLAADNGCSGDGATAHDEKRGVAFSHRPAGERSGQGAII